MDGRMRDFREDIGLFPIQFSGTAFFAVIFQFDTSDGSRPYIAQRASERIVFDAAFG